MATPAPEAPGAHQLDPPDELQIRLIMSVPPEQRVRNLLRMRSAALGMWLGVDCVVIGAFAGTSYGITHTTA